MTIPVAVVRPRRIAWVEGPDAVALLQGLLTADVEAIPVGSAVRSLVLTTHGHVVASMAVARDDDEAFTLVLDPPPAPDGVEVITAHHVSEDAEVLGPEEARVLVVTDDLTDALGEPGGPVVPGQVPGTIEVVVDDPGALAAARGIDLSPDGALEALRIARGAAAIGVDTGERTLVQEALLDHAVSFTKGCYLGQETVARLHYRGHPNRRLARIALDGPAPVGAAITGPGEVAAGEVTSVADVPDMGWVALAMVRREVPDGASVDVAGTAGRVLPAP
jgi:tRNA-modifying protein YgfZ